MREMVYIMTSVCYILVRASTWYRSLNDTDNYNYNNAKTDD